MSREAQARVDPHSERVCLRKIPHFGWGVFAVGEVMALGMGTSRTAAIAAARRMLQAALTNEQTPLLFRMKLETQLRAVQSLARLEGER